MNFLSKQASSILVLGPLIRKLCPPERNNLEKPFCGGGGEVGVETRVMKDVVLLQWERGKD